MSNRLRSARQTDEFFSFFHRRRERLVDDDVAVGFKNRLSCRSNASRSGVATTTRLIVLSESISSRLRAMRTSG